MPNFTKISDFALWRVSLLVFNREYLTAIRLVLCRWWWSVKCAKCWWIFPCQSNFPDSIHLTSIFSREENAYKFQFSPAPRLHARHEYSGYPRNEAYGFCAAIKNRRERALNRKRRPEATTVIIQILPVLTARNGFKRIIRARKHQSPPRNFNTKIARPFFSMAGRFIRFITSVRIRVRRICHPTCDIPETL